MHLLRSIHTCIRQTNAQAAVTASSEMLTNLAGKTGAAAKSAMVMGGRLKAAYSSARAGRNTSDRVCVNRWRLTGKASFRRACFACCLACA